MTRTFLLCLLRPFLLFLTRLRVGGEANLPRCGPAILASNHNSHLDTLIILSQFSLRSVHLVRPVAAVDHFFRSPLSSWFYRHVVGVVAIERRCINKSAAVLNECRTALARGEILVIYPEGTRGDSDQLGPLKGGIARLIEEFPNVPVIPVYIHGTREVLPRSTIMPAPGACVVIFGHSLNWTGSRRKFMSVLKAALERLQSDFTQIGDA